MLVYRAGTHVMLLRTQTGKTLIRLILQNQSDLGLHFLSRPFWHAISVIYRNILHSGVNNMLVYRPGTLKMLLRTAKREDPDQTDSSESV